MVETMASGGLSRHSTRSFALHGRIATISGKSWAPAQLQRQEHAGPPPNRPSSVPAFGFFDVTIHPERQDQIPPRRIGPRRRRRSFLPNHNPPGPAETRSTTPGSALVGAAFGSCQASTGERGEEKKKPPAEPSSRPKPVYDSTGAEGKLSAAAGGWQPPERTNLRALVEVFAF